MAEGSERRPHRRADIEPGMVMRKDDGSLWEVIAIADEPTMTLSQLKPTALLPRRVNLVISSPIAAEYERLIPESKLTDEALGR